MGEIRPGVEIGCIIENERESKCCTYRWNLGGDLRLIQGGRKTGKWRALRNGDPLMCGRVAGVPWNRDMSTIDVHPMAAHGMRSYLVLKMRWTLEGSDIPRDLTSVAAGTRMGRPRFRRCLSWN